MEAISLDEADKKAEEAWDKTPEFVRNLGDKASYILGYEQALIDAELLNDD